MNESDPRPTDEQLAALLASTTRDAPPPDRAVLARLREQSTVAFQAANTLAITPSPRKRTMILSSFRWIAVGAAAALMLGVVVAAWIMHVNKPAPRRDDPEDRFVVQKNLADDGRIGKVTDAQGVVAIKPVEHERWSPVQPRLVLKPGDWLRTDARGANAVAVKLVPATGVIVGPHSTVELVKPNEIRLIEGEIEISASAASPIELHGPDKQTLEIKSKQLFRVEKEKLVHIEKEPLWLAGFKGTTANESIGSLVAKVDGRNVPLTVGFHHVTIDIRDQIARTVIEESFVNRTNTVLEGVFYFPLPQDASISGFGMWIGDQLVEADVVEKQRAREIYETILREKRDPGLLEWTGGNIFKARVYPIPGQSEKRIKISYTQVLPRRGNSYRYSYGLQSELLRQHPLRDLSIDLKVNSAVPLKNVSTPTHQARVAKTEHSGHIEFSAQEYVPTRDFEAVIEVEGAGDPSAAIVIPHRRGDDGYFMVQLTPPGASADLDRPLIPNGDPLRLLLLADTSASMDRGQRATQNAVLAALLGALTSKDTINVAACDVNCDWIFEKPVPATAANIAIIRQVLAKRSSLGWTDLDKAFTSAMKLSALGTHVIYLGDGIVTTGDADPAAFAKRLARLYDGKTGTFHAITVGNSYEPIALKAIAALGGGSFRRVTGEQGPQAVALELLGEIASPTLRNLKVEFKGIRTARVYPEELPNVAAGTQQVLIGRYLPEGKDQTGEIIVTGMLGDKPVRFTAKISLADAEAGNSFIPRLWARMHLDKLLEQGSSEAIKQEIIALSEEYQIITPYTSLLVLESDADRERFAVKRRFQMRDGEKFFAQGRDNANYELKQQQMRKAGEYRTALRRKVLAQLMSLGRDTQIFQEWQIRQLGGAVGLWNGMSEATPASGPIGGMFFAGDRGDEMFGVPSDMPVSEMGRLKDAQQVEALGDKKSPDFGDPGANQGKEDEPPLEDDEKRPIEKSKEAKDMPGLRAPEFDDVSYDRREWFQTGLSAAGRSRLGADMYRLSPVSGEFNGYGWRGGRGIRLQWLDSLFPSIAQPAVESKEPKSTWPEPALALSRSLLRTEKLAKLKGGIVVLRQFERQSHGQPVLGPGNRGKRLELVSPTAWLGRSTTDGGQVLTAWCDAKEQGVYTGAFLLGRVRASTKTDLAQPPLELGDDSLTALHLTHPDWIATVEASAKPNSAVLVLKPRSNPNHELRYVIDTVRHVVLSIETRNKGKTASTTRFEDFVEVGGCWWAGRVETFDANYERLNLTTQTVKELSADEFAKQMSAELANKDKVLFLHSPLPTVADAKIAFKAGKATFDDRAVLMLHFAATQQWTRAREHLAECERLAGDEKGMYWLTNAFLFASRRHEELRKRLLDEGAALAATKDIDALANDFFLAEQINSQASQVLETNETLKLADNLQKIYQRQPAHMEATKRWRTRQVSLLQQAGQLDRALPLSKSLAVDFPRDHGMQHWYAQNLAGTGDYDAAYAWLNRVLVPEAKWEPDEENVLRSLYAALLEQQGRYRDLAEYLAVWTRRDPEDFQAYAMYLSALVRNSQAEKAEALVAQWLRDGQQTGKLPAPVVARLNAAVNFALGQGHNLYSNRLDERWHAPLAKTAEFFAMHEDTPSIASMILQHWRFQNTDAAREVRKTLVSFLTKELNNLSPTQLGRLIDWVWNSDMGHDDWAKLAVRLRKRWDTEKDPEIRHALSPSLARILSLLGPEEALAFFRAQWKQGPEDHRREYIRPLFDSLLSQPWKAEYEDEAFALLDQLPDPAEEAAGLFTRVAALHRLTDAMLENRFNAAMGKVEHPEKLTRIELHKKREENHKLAREGFADRLGKETARHDKPLAAWLVIERLWIDTLLERRLKETAADCWEYLSYQKPVSKEEKASAESVLNEILRDRYLTTLMHLAARKGADAMLIERLLKYIDQQTKGDPDDPQWRSAKFQLLIALDRPRDLEAVLTEWVANPEVDNRWRLALGYLHAEQGKIANAITLFEAVEAADELRPAEYRSLADWYMVANRRDKHDSATAAMYKTMDENLLSQRVSIFLRPWQRGDGRLPTQFDPEVLLVFKVLFEKSGAPQNYLWQLHQFYQASRDFRLLAMLPDGVIGHTAGQVYPFLNNMSGILAEVRDEATADELVARITAIRPTAKTAIDLRALDLLELLVERRAAEVQNQPGPHLDKALVALERAFKREWSPGEPRLMADFLNSLGTISRPALAREQLRQLESLHKDAKAGTFDRLYIAWRYSYTLNNYSRLPEATDLLEAALKEFEEANGGVLPTSANNALGALVTFKESAHHYDRGERLLFAQLKHPIHAAQKIWLVERLNQLYHSALSNRGEVSLGKGEVLYKALEKKLIADLDTTDQNHRYNLFTQLASVYRTAHMLKMAGVGDDLQAFNLKRLPTLLKDQIVNYDQIVRDLGETVRQVIDTRAAIAFLLDRIDGEPGWLRYNNQDAWSRYAWTLGQWRTEVKDLGDLEPRLLKVVLTELRRDLRSHELRSRVMYDRRHGHYWTGKDADFARVAEEVLDERKQSGASVEYIAEYLFHGLPREKRAIEALFAAHERKVLAESGQSQLAYYLHLQNRHAESIPLLQALIALRPENLGYRTRLMHAFFRTGKKAELLALLKQTDALFHEKDRWNEGAMAGLAVSCLENQLYAQSAAYYDEVIPVHQRTHARRGIGNGVLSGYYAGAARAFSGLGKTKEAVDRASGAVVSWGPTHQRRQDAVQALVDVLAAAADLDAYVAELDKEKLQSAVVRKAIGQAYVRKDMHLKAVAQFQFAAGLQPNDAETYTALITCYDKLGDKEGAVRQLLEAVELSRRDMTLFEQLGRRLAELKQPAEAERAYTSIVEMLPNESESHMLLAEVREKQNRWPDAIAEWQRVAAIRTLEPTGLLKLAAAQVHEKAWAQADETVRKLRSQSWPQRFTEVSQQIRELEKRIEQRERK